MSKVHFCAPQAPLAENGRHLEPSSGHRDSDGFGIFGNQVGSSNHPLIEICLLVPFPPPSTQGVSEFRVPATSPGAHDLGFHQTYKLMLFGPGGQNEVAQDPHTNTVARGGACIFVVVSRRIHAYPHHSTYVEGRGGEAAVRCDSDQCGTHGGKDGEEGAAAAAAAACGV